MQSNWYKQSANEEPDHTWHIDAGDIIGYLKGMAEMRKGHIPANYAKEYHYFGMEDFLLQHGKMYPSQPLTPEEMKAVKDIIGNASYYKSKQCFYNAQLIASANMQFAYVEGIALDPKIPIPLQHAWNTINGKVIDVTWKHLNNGKPFLGVLPEGAQYFGVEISSKTVLKVMMETGMAYSILDYPLAPYIYKKRYEPGKELVPPEFYQEHGKKKKSKFH